MMDAFHIPSLLDKDDLNGPSLGNFQRTSRGYSVDYAYYKISLFSNIEGANEKIRFIKDLDSLILQLGKQECNVLFPIFRNMVLYI